jgi:hypothetical protein
MQDKNSRKNFIVRNENFICEHCGRENPKLKGSCRNHCMFCLYSKHVDKNVPGDRESTCNGLMAPIEVDNDGKKGYVIIHKCEKCKKISRNKTAPDDDFDAIIKLSTTKRT